MGVIKYLSDYQRSFKESNAALAETENVTVENLIDIARGKIHSLKEGIKGKAKRKARKAVQKLGDYASEIFDEQVVKRAVRDYLLGFSEIPFIPKESIEYEGKGVWGFQNGREVEYLEAHRIKKHLGEKYEAIRKEAGLSEAEMKYAVEHYVKIHELAEKRLMECLEAEKLPEDRHGWLQARLLEYLKAAQDPRVPGIKQIYDVAYRIDKLRISDPTDEFGKAIEKYAREDVRQDMGLAIGLGNNYWAGWFRPARGYASNKA